MQMQRITFNNAKYTCAASRDAWPEPPALEENGRHRALPLKWRGSGRGPIGGRARVAPANRDPRGRKAGRCNGRLAHARGSWSAGGRAARAPRR